MHAERGADEAILASDLRDRDAGGRPRAPGHETLRRGADDVKAEVAPEAFRGLEPALFPAEEGQLGSAPDGDRPRQSLDIGGQPAFGNRLGLPKNCGGGFHGWVSLWNV